MSNDLLSPQCDQRGFIRRQSESLVISVSMQRLSSAQYSGKSLDCDTHDVVQRLLRGERDAHERGFLALKRSVMTLCQILRAARYLAISSKKSLCELKKKLSRGANSSMSIPRSTAYCAYSIPSRSVNASSCSAVEPASRM